MAESAYSLLVYLFIHDKTFFVFSIILFYDSIIYLSIHSFSLSGELFLNPFIDSDESLHADWALLKHVFCLMLTMTL